MNVRSGDHARRIIIISQVEQVDILVLTFMISPMISPQIRRDRIETPCIEATRQHNSTTHNGRHVEEAEITQSPSYNIIAQKPFCA